MPTAQQIPSHPTDHHVASTPKQTAKSLRKLYEKNIGLFYAEVAKAEHTQLCEILLFLPGEIFAEALKRIPHHRLAFALKHLESDEQTDFLQRVRQYSEDTANKIYQHLSHSDQQTIRKLSKYNQDEAGALMKTEMVTAHLTDTLAHVKQTVRDFRAANPNVPIIKLYVLDAEDILIANLSYADLFVFESHQLVSEVLQHLQIKKPISVRPRTPVSEVLRLFEEYDMSGLAVVSKSGKLKGRIIYEDVYELIRFQENDQALKMVGTDDEAELESFHSARRARLKWLMINLVAILVSAMIVGLFEATIEQIVALAILMPVVAALGGNVGNQAVTVTVRKLALGEIDRQDAYPVMKREVSMSLINGLVLGSVVSVIAYLWFQEPWLGAVVGIATLINLSLAGLIGASIPFVLKRIGADPAIAAPLLLTTVTDSLGFLIFLGLATLVLI